MSFLENLQPEYSQAHESGKGRKPRKGVKRAPRQRAQRRGGERK